MSNSHEKMRRRLAAAARAKAGGKPHDTVSPKPLAQRATHIFGGAWPVIATDHPTHPDLVEITYVGPTLPGNRRHGQTVSASRTDVFTGGPKLVPYDCISIPKYGACGCTYCREERKLLGDDPLGDWHGRNE